MSLIRKKIYITKDIEAFLVAAADQTGLSQSEVVLLLLRDQVRQPGHVIAQLMALTGREGLGGGLTPSS